MAAACYVICPQIMPQREKSIKHIFCPVNMLKTLIQWSLTMNMPPLLANIYECPIILPAIQDNRIANYKSKDFCPQPLRDLALGYAFGHGLFYCNIGCPVNLSFLTLKFYRTVIIKNDSCNHSKTGKMLYLCRVFLRRQTVYNGRTPIQYSYEACVSG